MKHITPILIVVAVFVAGCTSTAPLIGISPCGGPDEYHVTSPMPSAIFKAGGTPMILPMVRTESEAESLVSQLDGLVMTGGEDVSPSYYGEEVLDSTVYVNSFRDSSDMLLLKAAFKKNIPILGICRGEQITNVFFGGSLYQDIPSQLGRSLAHGGHGHWIYIEKDSRLHELMGIDSVFVNSFHHQAVKIPAAGLKVSAYAPDGVVEAFEAPGIIAVQFHPETLLDSGDERFIPIFKDLIEQASK